MTFRFEHYRWQALALAVLVVPIVAGLVQRAATRVVVDDFENGRLDSRFGTRWRVLSDSVLGGSSSARMALIQPGAQDSHTALAIRGTTIPRFTFPFAGVFVPLGKRRTNAFPDTMAHTNTALAPLETVVLPRDLRRYHGVEFFARGDGGVYTVELATSHVNGHDYYQFSFKTSPRWQKVQVPFGKLRQMAYGGKTALNREQSLALLFMHFQQPGAPATSFEFAVDQLVLY